MNRKKQEKGITLIALVVTILVLLILVGISLSALTGENGVIKRTADAKVSTDVNETKELIKLELMEKYDYGGNYTNRDVIDAVKKVTGNDVEKGVETTTSKKGNSVNIADLWVSELKTKVEDFKVGDKVYYDTGNTSVGNQGIIECTVLYDNAYNETNGKNYGIQIISTDVLKNTSGESVKLILGQSDPTARW